MGAISIGVGGFGGGGGDAGSATLTYTGNVSAVPKVGGDPSAETNTNAVGSDAIFVQSIGGAGGRGGLNVSGGIAYTRGPNSTTSKSRALLVGVGGFGGSGGDAGDVTVTVNEVSPGVNSDVSAYGKGKSGIYAQSAGGGGGKGGLNVTGGMTSDAALMVGIGGFGGFDVFGGFDCFDGSDGIDEKGQ